MPGENARARGPLADGGECRHSDEPVDEYRKRSRDRRGDDDPVRRLAALSEQTERQCREQEGEDPASDVLGAEPEQERVVDIEVVRVAQLEHHPPEEPGDERGDRRGPKPSALARPGVAPVQHRRDDDRREEGTNDIDD